MFGIGVMVATLISQVEIHKQRQAEYGLYLANLPEGETPKTFEEYFPVIAYERAQAEHRKQLELAEAGRARNWLETLLGK